MKIESLVRLLAGTFTLTGTLLGYFVNEVWFVLPAFVGFNLLQSAFTGFCPPTILLTKLGWVDADGIIHWGGRRNAT